MAYATTAEWAAAQPNTTGMTPMQSKVALESWQVQRPGYANPLDYQTYDQYALAANPTNKEFNTGSGAEIQNQANFYGMTVENYLNALSGNPTKPMGQYQSVYGSQLLSPMQQVAAQTARGQGIGGMTPQTLALAQANPKVFNEAAKKYRDYFLSTYPGSLEYEGLFAGPQQFSATGVKQPTASQANSMYVLDPATNTIVRNPNYTANFAMDQGTSRTGSAATMGNADVASRPENVQKVFDLVVANPAITDAEIVSAMKQFSVSPKDIAQPFGLSEGQVISRIAATVPNGQTVQLGDTIVQPKYRVTGSGETEEIGPLENVYSYRAGDNKVGGGYTQYKPDGTVERTGTQMKVDATKDFLKFVVGATALFGGAALAGLSPESISSLYGSGAMAGQGLTAAEALAAGLTPAQALAAGLTTAELTAAGYTATQLAGTATTGLLTGTADVVATNVVADAATGLTASQLASAARLGLTATQFAALLSSGGQTVAGLLQQETSREAAVKAQQMIDTETAAAKQAAAFRPVGMTTRFGTSEFKLDPKTGQLTSAGYTASPGVLEAQNRLVALGNQGLAQAEGAQAQFAPLQTGAQRLFGLGNQYLAQSPQDVAQNYLNQQMQLLQPGRELELANLQNRLQQQGRGGLAVAQGGTLGDTTPELQALYNARATQEAQLAANAQQYGQQQVGFGAGLLSQGAQTMGQYYGGQQAAYAPYTTALGQFQNLEQLAQQPLGLSSGLAQQSATSGFNVGRLGLLGAGQSVELATGKAATNNPYASALSGLTSNPLLTEALARQLGYTNQAGSLTAGLTPAQIAAGELGYPTDFSFVP